MNDQTPGPLIGENGGRHLTGSGRDVARIFGLFESAEAWATAGLLLHAYNLLDRTARALNVDAVDLCGVDLEGLILIAIGVYRGHVDRSALRSVIPEALDGPHA